MKTIHALLTTIIIGALAPCAVLAADIAGQWRGEFESQIGQQKYAFTFQSADGKLTGKAVGVISGETNETKLADIKLDGDTLTFVEPLNYQGNELRIEYTGKVSADEIKLTRKIGEMATEELTVKRAAAAQTAVNIVGQWRGEFDSQMGVQKYVYTFKTEDGKLTGKASGEFGEQKNEAVLQEIKLDGATLTFVEPLKFQDNEIKVEYTGKVSGDEIKFTRKVGDFATEELTAKRVVAAAAAPAPEKK